VTVCKRCGGSGQEPTVESWRLCPIHESGTGKVCIKCISAVARRREGIVWLVWWLSDESDRTIAESCGVPYSKVLASIRKVTGRMRRGVEVFLKGPRGQRLRAAGAIPDDWTAGLYDEYEPESLKDMRHLASMARRLKTQEMLKEVRP
jgi:hypothetical protein